MLTDTVERVRRMERCFDILLDAAKDDPTVIRKDPKLKVLLTQLLQYYEGGQWLRDYELDERGGIPKEIKRGVLSQDAVFDFLATIDGPRNNGSETERDADMEQGSAFDRMMKTAREWLADRPAEQIAANGGVCYDSERSVFTLTSLGRKVEIHYPDYTFSPDIEQWHQLAILHYLNLGDGTPPSGEWISLSQMTSGMIRGGGFDKMFEALVRKNLGNLPARKVREACLRMGMTIEKSNADLCALTSLAPLFPVTMKLWFADPEDDLPASGRIFVDRMADHFLTIEDTVLLCEYLIVDRLKQELGI